MTCKLFVAFTDGTVVTEEIPNHELADTQQMCEETPKDLFVAIEIENQSEQITFTYRRKQINVY